jgi:hypothetical protein
MNYLCFPVYVNSWCFILNYVHKYNYYGLSGRLRGYFRSDDNFLYFAHF